MNVRVGRRDRKTAGAGDTGCMGEGCLFQLGVVREGLSDGLKFELRTK